MRIWPSNARGEQPRPANAIAVCSTAWFGVVWTPLTLQGAESLWSCERGRVQPQGFTNTEVRYVGYQQAPSDEFPPILNNDAIASLERNPSSDIIEIYVSYHRVLFDEVFRVEVGNDSQI